MVTWYHLRVESEKKKKELTETESRKVVAKGLGRGEKLVKGYKLSAIR